MSRDILVYVIAPVLTGIAMQLFAYWLGKQEDN